MFLLLLGLILGCGGDPAAPAPPEAPASAPAPPSARVGQVLYTSPTHLVVQHDEVRDRVVPGPAVYSVPVPELTEALAPGDRIRLVVREREGASQVRQVRKTGSDPLPGGVEGPHPLRGTVVNTEPGRVTVDHEAIEGWMGAMVMSFLAPPDEVAPLQSGDAIEASVLGTPGGMVLFGIRVVGQGEASLREDIQPLRTGEIFPRVEVPVEDGSTAILGAGQPQRTALTFLYTTCPDPAFCPAVAARMQALQHEIAGEARILAITIDPEIDQLHVLRRYAQGVSADPGTWHFGRLEPALLQQVALLSGMAVTIENGRIAHLLRLLVLDRDGTVIERYDDNDWPLDRVVHQLRTGTPRPPPGQLGTRSDR